MKYKNYIKLAALLPLLAFHAEYRFHSFSSCFPSGSDSPFPGPIPLGGSGLSPIAGPLPDATLLPDAALLFRVHSNTERSNATFRCLSLKT